MNTKHAAIRSQQRGIPPMIDELLDRYGQEQHDGHGGIILYMNKTSIRSMERDFGCRPVARLSEWLTAYKVKSMDGQTVTIGYRHQRIKKT